MEASSRFFPFRERSSKVLHKVSVMLSCVFSDPPMIENLSACVIRLCPSVQSKPNPNKWAITFGSFEGMGICLFVLLVINLIIGARS